MLFVGERVDDAQPRRGVGEGLEPGLRECADHCGGDPALEVARHVVDRFPSAKRDVFGRLDGVAAELADGNLERGSRPQRRLLEEQRDVQAFERLFVRAVRGARRLELGRARKARRQLRRTEVQDRQELRRCRRTDSHLEC